MENVLLINAALTILFLSETYAGSTHDKRIAEATTYPLPAGSRLLQDLGFRAFTLDQAERFANGRRRRSCEENPGTSLQYDERAGPGYSSL